MLALMDTLRSRLAQREDSEHGQAAIRIGMVALILAYEIASIYRWDLPERQLLYVIGLTLLAQLLSLLLFAWIVARPARSDLRRVIGMFADYGLMAMAMSAVGEPMACIYVVVMWVTIGNGLRYGNRYLYLAIAMAMASFSITLATNEYWERNLQLGLALWLGLAAIPLYLSGLLRQLTRATAEARRASEAKSRFLANMSHEFRTPLNGLSGMTEVLAATRLDAEQRECVSTIQASARSLLALVEEVLDISAIEAGKVRVRRQDFALRETLDSIGLILKPQARNKGLDYRVHVPVDVPDRLNGDPDHVRQVLLNLIGNAVKFTERGSVNIQVSVADRSPMRLRFEIIDTGIGVPISMRPRLFEAFEQADNGLTRRYEGTGLGTTIAKGLVESMGGSIGYEENPGGGSRFWFEVPFEVTPSLEAQGSAQASVPSGAEPDNVIAFTDPFLRHRARVRSMQIVVGDDHEANRMVLQRLLQKAGHRVTCVNGAEAVLDALADLDYDAAIIDLHMPGMSGLDMLKQLRVLQAGGERRTPVVVLSADVTPDSIRQCERAGAYAFLAKPVSASRLLDTLADIAANRRLRQSERPAMQVASAVDGVLDPAVLNELASLGMGDTFEREFIQQCLTDAANCIAGIRTAAAGDNWLVLREQAHALKGVASNLGLHLLAGQGDELMRMQDWQVKAEIHQRIERLDTGLREGRAALDAHLSNRFEKGKGAEPK
ncbi:ATP-binding protein [[Pseudomonas] boreopolis]|uniref:ATP-binding protein n=1 Tax=Xanthomonas boreopolis TaxID=86183 RepID=UPI003D9B174B